jgi:hypothetical protein
VCADNIWSGPQLLVFEKHYNKGDCLLGCYARCIMSTDSIFRQMTGQVMEGSKYLWNVGKFMRLHGATSQNTVIFILAAVRTWNLKVSEKLSLIPSAVTLVQILMHLNLHKCSTVTLFLPLHQQIKEWRIDGFWAGLFPVMGWGRLYFHLLCSVLAYISYETPLEISLTLLTDYVPPSYSPQMKRGSRSMIQLVLLINIRLEFISKPTLSSCV